MKRDPASFLFSSTGYVGFITEVIQISEIVATVSLLLPGNLLHMELMVLDRWTYDLNRLTFLSFEILELLNLRQDFK